MLSDDDPVQSLLKGRVRIPILNTEQLREFAKTGKFEPELHDNWELTASSLMKNRGIAARVFDGSMRPIFERDAMLIIDLDRAPKQDDYVFAYIHSQDEIIFRKYQTIPNLSLMPVNTDLFKTISLHENDKICGIKICGIVIEARWSLV